MIQLAGPVNYGQLYPTLWRFRPSLNQPRANFSAQLAPAAQAASEVAETWHGDLDQPIGPDGNPLFMPATSWLIATTERRRQNWRTWLMDEWLIDYEGAQPGAGASGKPRAQVAAEVRQASAQHLEAGTKAMKTPLLPWWAWAAIAGGIGLVVWKASR